MAKKTESTKSSVVIPVTPEEKKSTAAAAAAELDAKFGAGTLLKLGQTQNPSIACRPFKLYQLDKALGGGMPKGRIVEIFGEPGSSKTTLALAAIAQAQREGEVCALIDVENSFNEGWAILQGTDTKSLYVNQSSTGEEALEVAGALISTGAFGLCAIDSVSALVPRCEIENPFGAANVGAQARLMSNALRKLVGIVNRTGTTLVFINQMRSLIGVMYGPTTTTSGGKSLPFYATQRMEMKRVGLLKDGEDVVGIKSRVKIVKNKIAPPFKEVDIDLYFDSGFDKVGSLLDAGVDNEAISKGGAWYSFEGERLGQGRDAATKTLRDNEDMYRKVYAAILCKDKAA